MPDVEDFDEAMLNPDLYMLQPHLQKGKAVTYLTGPKGRQCTELWARGGSFAVVYKFEVFSQKWKAIRCFKADVGLEMRDRYRVLTNLLKKNATGFTVGFDYWEDGVRDRRGKKHPILEMDWVEGKTLVEEVDYLCGKCKRSELLVLCQKWRDLIACMDRVDMAHGDLSGENVMLLRNGNLVLIDYDGVYFPDPVLQRNPSKEAGNPLFQHSEARGGGRKYNHRMDDFSALAIYVSLLAFSEEPGLFARFGSAADGKLLYEPSDLETPAKSLLFNKLRRLQGSEIRRLLPILENACVGPLAQTPRFVTLIDVSVNLRALINARPADWRKIHKEAVQVQSQSQTVPKDLALKVLEAEKRCRALDGLIRLLSQSPYEARRIKTEFEAATRDRLLDSWDEAKNCRALCLTAVEQVKRLDEFEAALRADPGRRGVVVLWRQYAQLLAGCKEAERWKAEVDTWEPRIKACDRLLDLVRKPQPWPSDLAVASAWLDLQRVGGHPDGKPYETLVSSCLQRRDCLALIRAVSAKETEATDREYDKIWNDSLLKNCRDVRSEERARWANARARLAVLDRLQQVIGDVDLRHQGTEQDIVNAVAPLLCFPGYEYRRGDRVRRAQTRVDAERGCVEAERGLFTALRRIPVSDLELDSAYQDLENTQQAYTRAWDKPRPTVTLSPEEQKRLQRARVRAPKLRLMREILARCPNEVGQDESLDRQLTTDWCKEEFLEPPESTLYCSDVQTQDAAGRVERAKQRLYALGRLRGAIASLDAGVASAREVVHAARCEGLPLWYLQKAATEWKRIQNAELRDACTNRLSDELRKPPSQQLDSVIAKVWKELGGLGGDPGAKTLAKDAEVACGRAARLGEIEKLHDTHSETSDTTILSQWVDSLKERAEGARLVPRVKLAQQRTNRVTNLRTAIQRVDRRREVDQRTGHAGHVAASVLDDEKEAAIVAAALPVQAEQYDDAYLSTVRGDVFRRLGEARRRSAATQRLESAVVVDLDLPIATRWEELDALGGDPAAERHRARAILACRRRDGLQRVTQTRAGKLQADVEDRQLIGIWNEYNLGPCKDVDVDPFKIWAPPLRKRIQLAEDRVRSWKSLAEALKDSDREEGCFRVLALYQQEFSRTEPLLRGYPPFQQNLTLIETIVRDTQDFQKFWDSLADPRQFADAFDYSRIEAWRRKFPGRIHREWPRIRENIQRNLGSQFRLQPQPYSPDPTADGCLAAGQIDVFWYWPRAEKWISHCLVAVRWNRECERPVTLRDTDDRSISPVEDKGDQATRIVNRQQFDDADSKASISLPAVPVGRDKTLHVAVWPLVELKSAGTGSEWLSGAPLTFQYDFARPRPPASENRDQEPAGVADRLLKLLGI
jgi:hypothetical protein